MKKIFIFCSLLSSISLANNLKINILNKNLSGTAYLNLYDNKEKFLKPDKAYKKLKFNLTAEETTIILKDLPYGDYAFTIFLDKNNNGKLDTNLIKIPQEPSAFSNNYKPKFKPSFNSAKFSIQKEETIENIILK
ncbi:MAG: DUF2141 domain-containing protein [Cetobacterium sp.]|uniref:DUF2141 domain-containing protein n=1 Tax=Cetobacterium sp. TaxID=2071632 RepID=UPI003F2E7EFB